MVQISAFFLAVSAVFRDRRKSGAVKVSGAINGDAGHTEEIAYGERGIGRCGVVVLRAVTSAMDRNNKRGRVWWRRGEGRSPKAGK